MSTEAAQVLEQLRSEQTPAQRKLKELRDREQTLLRSTFTEALESQPDTAARAREIEQTTQIPAPVAERQFEAADRLARLREIDSVLGEYPQLRQILARHPATAKLVHDDVEATGGVERAARALGAGGTRFLQGVSGFGQAALENTLVPLGELLYRARILPVNPAEQLADAYGQSAQDLGRVATNLAGDRSGAGVVEKGVYSGIESVAQQAPLVVASVLLRNPNVALSGMGATTVGQEYATARAAGIPADQSLVYATSQGMIEVATERIPLGKLLEDLAVDTGLVKMVIGQMLTEIPQEQVATFFQDMNQWAVLNPDKPFADYIAERPNAALETFVATLVAAGTQTAVASAVNAMTQGAQDERSRIELADAKAKALNDLLTAVQGTKLLERAPDVLEQLVQNVANGGEVTDVYIDARLLKEALQSTGIAPADAGPSIAQQLEQAAATGGDVRVPIGEFAARVAQQDWAPKILQHVRTSPEDLSPEEAKAAREGLSAQLKAEAERALEANADDEAYAQSVARVETALREQLTKANRFTADVNDAYAAMMRDFYVTTAERVGMSPDELYARYPLRVTAESIAGAQMDQNVDELEIARALKNTIVEEGGEHIVLEGDNVNQNASVSNIRRSASARLANANVGPVAPGMTRFRHFGNRADVAALDPKFMGTGMKGEERFRGPVPSVSLYPDTGFQKESGVGPHEFVVDVPTDRLYDANKDPLKLGDRATVPTSFTVDEQGNRQPAATRFDMTEFEKLVKEAGFAGYTTPEADGNLKGQARIFEPIPVDQSAELKKLRSSGTLFQLAPELEPQGFASIKPFLTPDERAKLKRNTAAKLVQVFKDLPKDADFAAAALAGVAKKGWYAHSARAIRDVFGDADAPRFAALMAALSPQVPIDVNLVHAAQTWVNWDEAGRPTDEDKILEILDRSVWGGAGRRALGAWRNNTVRALQTSDPRAITLSGPKVDSFMRNLLGDVQEVTNDTWMANFALINQTVFSGRLSKSGSSKAPGYVAMNAKLRRVAERLTKETGEEWTAPEVQETVWSWAKTAVELADMAGETRSVEDLVREGAITDEHVASAPDFATMFKENRTVREILEAAGYAQAINAIEVEFGRGSVREGAGATRVTPGLLRSARRLDKLRAQREEAERVTRAAKQTELGEDQLPKKFVMLSAERPQFNPAENAERSAQLEQDLIDAGYEPQPAQGMYKGVGEQSFMVPVEDATDLAAIYELAFAKYEQESVLRVDEQRNAELEFQNDFPAKLGTFLEVESTEGLEAYTQIGDRAFAAAPSEVLSEGTFDQPGVPRDELLTDDNGKPMVVYHGTTANFDEFEQGDLGFHFGTAAQANSRLEVGDENGEAHRTGANIRPAYLRLTNPLVMRDVGGWNQAELVMKGLKRELAPELYDELAEKIPNNNVLQRPRANREALETIRVFLKELGYDGVEYPNIFEAADEGDLDNSYIVFDKDQIVHLDEFNTLKQSGPNADLVDDQATGLTELAQGQTSAPRGQIQLDGKGGATIALLQNADLSTFLHESGHFFLEVYADLARQNAPGVSEDFAALLKWFGVPDAQAWQSMTLEQRRPHHEKFARGFEAYLFEGNAPTAELTSLFAKFRSWLINVYRTLTSLDVELTPEVRQVFDRMLASEDKINATERARNLAPLFPSPDEIGMTPEEHAAYVEAATAAHDSAVNELQARSLRDMRWASNARARELKKLQADVVEKRDALRAEAEQEVRAEPVYQALRFVRSGELTMEDGTKLTEAGEHKLDRVTLEKMGVELDDKLVKRGGVHPDLVAEMFGFTSGDHLIKELKNAALIEDVIEAVTDRKMLERYGDLTDPQRLERAADEAVHNDARTRFVATELKALTKALNVRAPSAGGGSINVTLKAAKEFAETTLARRKVRDVKPQQFLAAEARAAKEAEQALAAGDLAAAAAAKRNQLVNMYATRASMELENEVRKARDYLAKFEKGANIDQEYLEQIHQLLERFDLKRGVSAREAARRKTLASWVDAQRALGFEPAIDEDLLAEARRQPYQEMTVEQFRGLVDTVRNVEHLGRLKKKLLTAQRERDFQEAVDAAAKSIEDNATKEIPEEIERNSFGSRLKEGVSEFFAMHRKFASIVRQMDGFEDGGTLWDLFVRPLNKANDTEAQMRADATKKLSALFRPLLKKGGMRDKLYIPEIDRSLSREGRIAVALNWGNETNRKRVTDGDKWTEPQVNAILDTLTKEEWDFVQGVWDFVGSYWPEIAAKEKRVSGVAPERVEAAPVKTKFGELKGGYYPIKYDPARSSRAEADSLAETLRQAMQGLYTRATTRRGHTKQRVEEVKRPVRKDLGVLFEHVEQVVHDLSFHEYLIDANRLLRAPAIDSAIRKHHGPQFVRQMRNTLEDVAVGDVPAQNAFERALNHIRTGSTIAGLGWNVSTSLLQPLGLTQSMARIGPKWVGRGLARWIGSAARMENGVKFIHDRSPFMKNRAQTMQREIREVQGRVHGGKRQAVTSSFFFLIQKMQMVADVPTWLGQYEKTMEQTGDEQRAIELADQAVRDSQGSGAISDLAAIQRGGPLMKLWTNFYSFFNTTYNLAAESGRKVRKPKDLGRAAADYVLLFTLPATLAALMKAALDTDDDDDELAETIVRENLSYMLGTVMLAREMGSVLSGYSYRGPAGIRGLQEIADLIQQGSQGEVDEAAVKAAADTAGILFHLPTGQAQRTVEGAAALIEGETENPAALISGHRD